MILAVSKLQYTRTQPKQFFKMQSILLTLLSLCYFVYTEELKTISDEPTSNAIEKLLKKTAHLTKSLDISPNFSFNNPVNPTSLAFGKDQINKKKRKKRNKKRKNSEIQNDGQPKIADTNKKEKSSSLQKSSVEAIAKLTKTNLTSLTADLNINKDTNENYIETKNHLLKPIYNHKRYRNIPTPEPGYQCRPQPLDVVFLMDGSKSIKTEHFRIIKEKIKETLPTLLPLSPKDTQVAVIQFGSIIKQEIGLKTSYRINTLRRKISQIRHMQAGTMTGAAIKTMLRKTIKPAYGGRYGNPNVKTVGIIITDGRSQDRTAATYWAEQAKKANITLYTIGIGKRVNQTELENMASKPTLDHFFLASDFDSFKEVSIDLKPYICFDLDECEENQHNCEHKCVNNIGSYSCKCHHGYELHTDGRTCTKIDPCLNSPCDHNCHPVNGTLNGFLCSCNDGYILQADKTSCQLYVPDPPRNLTAQAADQVSLDLFWKMPNLFEITSYQIKYFKEGYPEEEQNEIIDDPNVFSKTLIGLESDSLYNISITAQTKYAMSKPLSINAKTAAYDFTSWEIQTDHQSTIGEEA